MSKRIDGFSLTTVLVTGTALAGVTGLAFAATSAETLLRSSFKTALALPSEATPLSRPKAAPLSGTEDYWLSAMQQDGRGLLGKTVSIGDRIAMTLGGVERHMEVSAVAEFQPNITAIDTASNATRLVLVTARDTRDLAAHPIRFVMEIETGAAPLITAKAARTS